MSRIAEAAFGDTPYPERPGFKEPTTSRDAAKAVEQSASALRYDVMHEIVLASPLGLTADEVAARLSKPVLAIRPRVSELVRAGSIVKTGERRANAESGLMAAVWKAKP